MQKSPLVLRPRYNPLIGSFLNNEALISQIVLACGSPTSVLFPQAIEANVKAFQSVLDEYTLNSSLFFAHKANQSDSLLKQLAVSGVNCDVASVGELKHALASGFSGNRLQATGPKDVDFLHLCLLHDVAINVDCVQELKDILSVKEALGIARKARILLRLSNFKFGDVFGLPPVKLSRFGIHFAQIAEVLSSVIAPHRDNLALLGFSFHLDSTSVEERSEAIRYCFEAFEKAIALDLTPHVINIGGGFGINYLAHEEDWSRYVAALKEAALTSQTGAPSAITWNHNFFGLSAEGGALRGSLNAYSFFNPLPGSTFLKELLASKLQPFDKCALGDMLRNNEIALWLEPGRALLDLAGVTLARVNSLKGPNNDIVGLDMKRQDLAFLDQEIFVDPIQIRTLGKSDKRQHKGYFLSGNLCLESDLIFRRKVFLPELPRKGDIFAFINTAAYMMDFSVTNSIMQPTARRAAVVEGKGKALIWMLDEQYSPVWKLH
ncbi:MAG: hypothetical protein K2Y22_15290 [Candidatus Obscuribacterales bacterium]|nr:hypothetical protein [Candidatus Obscuribacterales bacterium]